MPHFYWIYRRRDAHETIDIAERNSDREYQNLGVLFSDRWPGSRFRSMPAQGIGVRISITVQLANQVVDRFVFDRIMDRNVAVPTARLNIERYVPEMLPARSAVASTNFPASRPKSGS